MKSVSKNIYNFFIIASLLFISCDKKSAISKEFDCETTTFNNLEMVDDVKNLFSVDLPKDWKVNLYQDEIQSSIFAADTTKQLTETVLLDVTFINKKISFNDAFLLQQDQEHLANELIRIKTKEISFIEKPSMYLVYKGKKGKFEYQVCNTFIKVNESNFILAKTEVYGDSIINQRFCQAFSLMEHINIKN